MASTFIAGKDEYSTTIKLEDADYVCRRHHQEARRRGWRSTPARAPRARSRPPPTRRSACATTGSRCRRLKAGKQTLRVTNDGDVLHHALVFPLAKGVNGSKLLKKIKAGKEPRKEFAGPPSALVEIVSPETRTTSR